MPTPTLDFLRSWRHRLFVGLCAMLLAPIAIADADVLVVTDSHHPVLAPAGTRIIALDQPSRIEADLAAHLPSDPVRGAAIVQRRLKNGGEALHQQIARAYQGVADAWSLGITRIPAVVVDQRYVVYGESDVARAIARIDQHRRAQP